MTITTWNERVELLDTENLKAFVAVAASGSFSQAANRLFLTQPAVSKRIAGLEQKLNCSLFYRMGKTVSLTEAGRELLPRAEAILDATAQAIQAMNDLSGRVKGELRLATSHHMGLHHLPAHLRRFADRYPGVTFSLDFQDSEVAMSQVLTGQVELAALTLASQFSDKLVPAICWDDPLVFVAARDHPLSQKPAPKLDDLAKFAAILPEANTFTTQLVIDLFRRQNQPLETRMATNYLETVKMLVSIGLGWGVLPKTMVENNELEILPVLSEPLVRQLGIVHHRDRHLSNASCAFLELVKG